MCNTNNSLFIIFFIKLRTVSVFCCFSLLKKRLTPAKLGLALQSSALHALRTQSTIVYNIVLQKLKECKAELCGALQNVVLQKPSECQTMFGNVQVQVQVQDFTFTH